MIEYPPLVPGPACARIEGARAAAEVEFIESTKPLPSMYGDLRGPGERDRCAVFYVLEVFETVVQILCELVETDQWSADQLGRTADDLLDQLTRDTYTRKHSHKTPIEAFTTLVHQELRTFPFWSALQATITGLAAADLGRRRAKLLADYKAAVGDPVTAHIFEQQDVPINKTDFYNWLNGTLPATSATVVNFERWLKDHIAAKRGAVH